MVPIMIPVISIGRKRLSRRVSYAEGNKARKEQLKPTILQAEEQLNALLEQPGELEKKARNAEINYLKNKR